MSQINLSKTNLFTVPPENCRSFGFDAFGNPVFVKEDGTAVVIYEGGAGITSAPSILANLGVGLAGNIPQPIAYGVYVTKDSFAVYKAINNNTWASESLQVGQFITDTSNPAPVLYQFLGTSLYKIPSLVGLLSTVDELNYSQGLSGNIQAQLNAVSSIGNFTGTAATYADIAISYPTPLDRDLVIVLADENYSGKSTTYVYSTALSAWNYTGEFTGAEVRNFVTNPIDLESEITGILPEANISNEIARNSDIPNVSGFVKINQATPQPIFGGALEYDETTPPDITKDSQLTPKNYVDLKGLIDSTGFIKNLDESIISLQLLANAVDNLPTGGGGGNGKSVIGYALSDADTPLIVGEKDSQFIPYAFTLESIFIAVNKEPTEQNLIIDIKIGVDSIFSTLPAIVAGSNTSLSNPTQPVLSKTVFSKSDKLINSIVQVGGAIKGSGLKIYLIGTQS